MEEEKVVEPYKLKAVTDQKEAVYKEIHHKTAVQPLLFLERKMESQISKLVTQNMKEKRMPLKYTFKGTLGMYPLKDTFGEKTAKHLPCTYE